MRSYHNLIDSITIIVCEELYIVKMRKPTYNDSIRLKGGLKWKDEESIEIK